MCKKCGQQHDPNTPCPSQKVEAQSSQSEIKKKTGCCGKCGTYHPETEENCPRANR